MAVRACQFLFLTGQVAYPEPFKLLIPGGVEGEALDGRLVGLVMQLELDVGV